MAGQENARGNPHSTVQRVPPPGAIERKVQLVPWIRLREGFAHRLTIKAQLGNRENTVGIDPGVWSANRTFNLLAPCICKLRDLVEAKVSLTRNLAQWQTGYKVEETK